MRSERHFTLGFACGLLLRRRSAAAQNLIWRITLGALALLPIGMALISKAGTPPVMEPIRAAIPPITSPRPRHAITNPKYAAQIEQADLQGTLESRFVAGIYAVGLVGFLAVWFAGYIRMRGIANSGTAAPELSRFHRVIVAADPELRVPISFGAFKPLIVLPRDSAQWPDERVRAALLHESAHIGRKDWAWQTGALLLRAIQWFNPAAWLTSAALQATSETAADDEVLMQFAMGPATYAGELLKVAESASGKFAVATAMARPGGVSARLKRIVAKGIERERPRRRFGIGLVSVFTIAGVMVAAGTVAEAAPDGRVAISHSTIIGPLANILGTAVASLHPQDEAYEAKLSHGGLVRMVAMAADGNKSQLWGPDGTPAPATDRQLLSPVLSFGTRPPNGRVIAFFLQVSKLPMKPGESENGIFRIPSPSTSWEYQGGSNVSSSDGRLQWDQWIAPPSAKTVDMDCAITYGPYKEIGSGTIGDDQFHSKVEPQNDQVHITMSVPAKYGQTQTQLECFDQDGIAVSGGGGPLEGQKDPATGDVKWDFWFSAKDAKKIETYKLKIRRYEHVVLKGIRLPSTEVQP